VGKILLVDLAMGQIREDAPEERLYRDFIGGYGIGARVMYDQQKAGADLRTASALQPWERPAVGGSRLNSGWRV
jgi:aldehyde:ferredoxin oxidoreductase